MTANAFKTGTLHKRTRNPFERRTRFNALELMAQTFPPLQYVIDGIVPEGLTLLVAPPKTGKSWLVLDVADAISKGATVLGGIRTGKPRPVLYLALEDGARRLQDRLVKIGATQPAELLEFVIKLEDDVLPTINGWVSDHADDSPVVILDTLGKVMPPSVTGETDYQRDYRVGGSLKAITDDFPGAAVIVVHHTRKAVSEDFLDAVSGTQGLAGAADSIVVLRRERAGVDGSLSVTSRDAAEGEYAAKFEDLRWRLAGSTLREASEALQQRKVTSGLEQRSADLVAYVNEHPEGVRAADVEELLDVSNKDAGTYLRRAFEAGRIEKLSRGLYGPVGNVGTVGNGEVEDSPEPTLPTLPTPTSAGNVTELFPDPGYCSHGVTIGSRCSKCGGTATTEAGA